MIADSFITTIAISRRQYTPRDWISPHMDYHPDSSSDPPTP